MNRYLLGVVLIALTVTHGCKQEKKIAEIITAVEKEHAPDRRENVYNISYKNISSMTYILTGETDSEVTKKALLDTLNLNGFKIIDSVRVLPHQVTQPWGIITLSVANLRSEPSHTAELLTQALMGTPVKILKETKRWAYVQTPDHYLAWCEKIAITFKDQTAFQNWKQSNRIFIKTPFTFITDPETGLNISDAVMGNILEVKEYQKESLRVQLPDGREGVINPANVSPWSSFSNMETPNTENLVNEALKFRGIPYLWGGTSVKAVDCSGFVKSVYFINGIILARDASLQVNHGTPVPLDENLSNLQTGDLLFFASEPGGNRITHVGMYLGDSEMIHASGLVRINSLDSTRANYTRYYTSHLHSAKRIIGADPTKGIIPVMDHPWYSDNIE